MLWGIICIKNYITQFKRTKFLDRIVVFFCHFESDTSGEMTKYIEMTNWLKSH